MAESVDDWVVKIDADTTALESQLQRVNQLGRQLGTSLSNAFQGLVVKGRSFDDVLRSLALNLSQIALRAAFKPLETALGSTLSSLVSGVSATGGGSPLALQGSVPMPFARGGVISSPISFPLGDNRIGVAGERGAEAIMPLARGADGRLGVAAQGGAGNVSVTFHISTPDVAGFQRSQSQIASLLTRTIGQGQRNL
jgi:phage-related minor tail protein